MTLGYSEAHGEDLANMVQLGWWETPTSLSSSQLVELEMDQMTDQGGSWMNMILKED